VANVALAMPQPSQEQPFPKETSHAYNTREDEEEGYSDDLIMMTRT